MSDERDTIPSPPDDDLREAMRELRAALERTSELCVKVLSKLSSVQIAQYAAEHRMNVQRDEIDGLKLRFAELVTMLPPPPPEAA